MDRVNCTLKWIIFSTTETIKIKEDFRYLQTIKQCHSVGMQFSMNERSHSFCLLKALGVKMYNTADFITRTSNALKKAFVQIQTYRTVLPFLFGFRYNDPIYMALRQLTKLNTHTNVLICSLSPTMKFREVYMGFPRSLRPEQTRLTKTMWFCH